MFTIIIWFIQLILIKYWFFNSIWCVKNRWIYIKRTLLQIVSKKSILIDGIKMSLVLMLLRSHRMFWYTHANDNLLQVIALARMHAMQNVFIIRKLITEAKFIRSVVCIVKCWDLGWDTLCVCLCVLWTLNEKNYYDTYCTHTKKKQSQFEADVIGEKKTKAKESQYAN